MTTGPEVEWGIRPTLFHILGWGVPSYSFFMVLAVGVGLLLFWYEAARQRVAGERTVMVLLGAVFGGVLGSKIPMIMLYWREMLAQWPDATLLVTSRSIVGGLVGGALGVYMAKRWFGVSGRRGNLFVPGIAAGIAIGRLGCFLRGCCHGRPAGLSLAVDFGDGVPRHPTQLYEMVFMLVMLVAGWTAVRRWPEPAGLVFKVFMLVYFAFRFVIEFMREERVYGLGLTLFQWISAAMVAFYALDLVMLLREGNKSRGGTTRKEYQS